MAGSADEGSAMLLFLILEVLIFFAASLRRFTGFMFCAKTKIRAVARHGKCWDGIRRRQLGGSRLARGS